MGISFLSIGGSTEDFTFYTSEGSIIKNRTGNKGLRLWAFNYASKIKVDQAYSTYGGGAANAAVNFSGLGFRSAIMSAIGDDERGVFIESNFVKKGVDVTHLQKIKKSSSSSSFIAVGKDSEYVAFVSRGAANELRLAKKDASFIRSFDWVYLASLSGRWQDNLKNLFSNRRDCVFWDPGKIQIESGVDYLIDYIKKTDIISLNLNEVLDFLSFSRSKKLKTLAKKGNKKDIMRFFRSLVKQVVIITNGGDGAYAFDGKKFCHQKALRADKKVDTTGVGDAFASSFLAGFSISGNLEKSMLFAAANAKSVIGKIGAQNGLLDKKDFRKFFGVKK